MVLISLQPFAFRKGFLLVTAAILALLSASCFAESIFLTVPTTPYDRQMSRIMPVLHSVSQSPAKAPPTINDVNEWMMSLRAIPYGFSPEWKTPSEVQTAPVADCKGKAVALYERLRERGATNVRLVIGKRLETSRVTHAWVVWATETGTYVLDPTINWMAYRSESLRQNTYVPYYAYTGTRKYRAASALLFAKN